MTVLCITALFFALFDAKHSICQIEGGVLASAVCTAGGAQMGEEVERSYVSL